eukprot:CAMPEP_0119377522 /NCGR_PEP_ID=MMETSP1334-20130426/45308_1 /TAXON_ID=127549 /ORGANISM="Calcidiscus leptoporus, Strain RCC1130" /LENGTH=229 /DNA_ID=CAMNT_0007396471 /DNA_START=123 /DNA_END=808 /DNA_ORIENTATION=+
MLVAFLVAQPSALALQPVHARSAAAVRSAAAMMSTPEEDARAALLAHLKAPIRQYEGGWGDTAMRDGGKNKERFGKGPTPDVEKDKEDNWSFAAKLQANAPPPAPPAVEYDGGLKTDVHGNFEGHNAAGNKITTDGNVGNYRRASDALKEADVERRKEEEEVFARENAAQLAREAKERKIALMQQIPDDIAAGTVDDFMYKEGVKDILEKLDYDLIGLKPVKQRVREIA